MAEKKTRKNNENKTCAYFYGAGICIYWVLTKYSYLHLLIIDLINAIKAFKYINKIKAALLLTPPASSPNPRGTFPSFPFVLPAQLHGSAVQG